MAAHTELHSEKPIARRAADFGDACDRVYDAGHQLLARRLELGALEARLFARSGAFLVFAALVALAGWLYFVSGAIDALARTHPRFAVEMGVGAFHAIVACGLVALSRHLAPGRGDRP